jgi:hypothetical protein
MNPIIPNSFPYSSEELDGIRTIPHETPHPGDRDILLCLACQFACSVHVDIHEAATIIRRLWTRRNYSATNLLNLLIAWEDPRNQISYGIIKSALHRTFGKRFTYPVNILLSQKFASKTQELLRPPRLAIGPDAFISRLKNLNF